MSAKSITCVRIRRDGIDRVNYDLSSPLLDALNRSTEVHGGTRTLLCSIRHLPDEAGR